MSGQNVDYPKKLRRHRKQAGVSQQAVAEALGFAHASSVSRWETDKTAMSRADFAEAIAAIERIVERRQKAATSADVLAE